MPWACNWAWRCRSRLSAPVWALILTASASAFYAIKWFGVAYLVYLAIKQWRALPSDMSDDAAVRQIGKPMALVFRGFLVNISNPKALVFMLAVLPQFIDPHAPLLVAVSDHRR